MKYAFPSLYHLLLLAALALLAGPKPAWAQCVVRAVAQNVTVSPGPNGTVTVPASAVNNGSVASCGFASGGGLSLAPNTFGCPAPTPNYALTFTYSAAKYVQGTHPLLPQGNAPRTLECWVYVTAANSNSSLFNYRVATDNHRSGILLIAGKLYYVGEFNDVSDTQNLTLNTWHHVAATYDGTTVRLYVDGALRVAARPPSPAYFATTGTTWRIAKRMDPKLDEYIDGSLDEVRVWDRALSAAEIATSATRTNPASLAGLIANWDMNQGTGSTLRDITGNSPAGTLYNAPAWTQPGIAYNGQPATLTVTDVNGTVSRAQTLITVRDALPPTTVARAVTLPLPAAGTAPLPATALDNGSADNCSAVTLGAQKVVTGQAATGSTLTLTAPPGQVFTALVFASYGTPVAGPDGTYAPGACHAATSPAVVAGYLLGRSSAAIPVTAAALGDPCPGTAKTLVVQAVYGAPLPQLTYSCTELGANLAWLTATDALGNAGHAPAAVTVTGPAVAAGPLSGPATVCGTQPQQYQVAGPPGTTYQWVVTGGTLLAGQGTSQATVQFAAGAATYAVSATPTSAAGCPGPAVSLALPPENPVLTLPLASVAADNAQVTLGFAATGTTAPLRVLRRVAGQGSFAVVGTVAATATTFTDGGLDAATTSYEYRLEVPTSCGPTTSSPVAQTILLAARATPGPGGPDQGRTDLRWNAYAGFPVTEYRLLGSLDGGPWTLLATLPGTTLQAAVPNLGATPGTGAGVSQRFRVVAAGPGSPALLANSNTAAVRFANPLRFYNLITPDGDGRNDRFVIDNISFYAGSTLRIFDRWGRPVYAATDYRNTWGDAPDVAPGLYYYVLTVPDAPAYKGWVEVLK